MLEEQLEGQVNRIVTASDKRIRVLLTLPNAGRVTHIFETNGYKLKSCDQPVEGDEWLFVFEQQ